MGRRLATQWRSLAFSNGVNCRENDNSTCSNLRVTSSPERSKPIEEVWPAHSGWTVPFTTDELSDSLLVIQREAFETIDRIRLHSFTFNSSKGQILRLNGVY